MNMNLVNTIIQTDEETIHTSIRLPGSHPKLDYPELILS